MVICGDAGDALGDSLYEAVIYVKGNIKSLGADARIEPMSEADCATVRELLDAAGCCTTPVCNTPPAPTLGTSSAWPRPAASTTGTPTRTRSTDMSSNDHPKYVAREESFGYDRKTILHPRARRTACTRSAAWAPSASCRNFDDLVFLGASLSRYPLEGYREKCSTKTVLGTRFAKKPIELDIPITIAGMSFGSLSANVKEALGARRPRSAPRPPPATAA
jgi:glutamate synthase domain-containing protein 2